MIERNEPYVQRERTEPYRRFPTGLTVPSLKLYINNTGACRVFLNTAWFFCSPGPPLSLPVLVDYSSVLFRIGLVVACLAGPIIWGVIVNWLFTSWQSLNVNRTNDEEDPVFPDYQI